MIVNIHEARWPEAKKFLDKLSIKTERLFDQPIGYMPIGYNELESKHESGRFMKMLEIFISAPTIKINGWNIKAEIDHNKTNDGNVINLHDEKYDAETYRFSNANCEHCGFNRKRLKTFIICNEENETKQIGSTCLNDFIGYDVDALLSHFKELKRTVNKISNMECFEYDYYRVTNQLDNQKSYFPDVDMADCIEWFKSFVPKNTYETNIKTVMDNGYVHHKHLYLVRAAIILYRGKIIQEKYAYKNDYYKNVGDQINENVMVTNRIVLNGAYGRYYMYIVRTEGNYRIKFFTTKVFEVNSRFVLTGTVKSYDEYKEMKSTVVTIKK